MINLKYYLEMIQTEEDDIDESIFPIDSVHTGKPASKKVISPMSENLDIDGKRILIDFDQTIHKYTNGWDDGIIYDEPIEGAKESINKLREDGYEVIIFTSRLSEATHGLEGVENQRQMIKEWLDDHDIKVDGMTSEKLPAEFYIDDRAVRFDVDKGGWESVIKIIG